MVTAPSPSSGFGDLEEVKSTCRGYDSSGDAASILSAAEQHQAALLCEAQVRLLVASDGQETLPLCLLGLHWREEVAGAGGRWEWADGRTVSFHGWSPEDDTAR